MEALVELGKRAASAKYELQKLSATVKNKALHAVAEALEKESNFIIQ